MNDDAAGLVPASGDRREASSPVHAAILDSMTNGVMSVDGKGVVRTFNDAASRMLGLDRREVEGSSFAASFVAHEGFDAFNEVVLESIYGKGVTRGRRVALEVSGAALQLDLTTSYLGGTERGGVVAVFSDATETEALRAKEQALAGEVERQNEELRGAYRELESRNGALGGALRKVQIARIATTAVLAVLAGGVALHGSGVSLDLDLFGRLGSLAGEAAPQSARPAGREHVVKTGRVESIVSVPGEVSPLVEVAVRSPTRGTVAALLVEPGQRVRAGEPLIELNIEPVVTSRRKAEIAWRRANAREEALAQWDSGSEVGRVRRALNKARIELDKGRAELEETAFLYERGLVSRTKKESAEREQQSRKLDLVAAERDLETILAEGRANLELAVLEARNAEAERSRLDKLIEASVVTAPIDGVVLGRGQGAAPLAAGDDVQSGELLLSISDGRSIGIEGRIDEVRIREIEVGDPVRISGAAFPRVKLDGRIASVSAHATRGGSNALPSFPVVGAVDNLGEELRDVVRLGMSARMDIVVYERDDAVLVPVAAVDSRSRRVEVVDPATGERRRVRVRTGRTTAQSVEILSGLKAGDVVVVP